LAFMTWGTPLVCASDCPAPASLPRRSRVTALSSAAAAANEVVIFTGTRRRKSSYVRSRTAGVHFSKLLRKRGVEGRWKPPQRLELTGADLVHNA
jgi:hypothetical protein